MLSLEFMHIYASLGLVHMNGDLVLPFEGLFSKVQKGQWWLGEFHHEISRARYTTTFSRADIMDIIKGIY